MAKGEISKETLYNQAREDLRHADKRLFQGLSAGMSAMAIFITAILILFQYIDDKNLFCLLSGILGFLGVGTIAGMMSAVEDAYRMELGSLIEIRKYDRTWTLLAYDNSKKDKRKEISKKGKRRGISPRAYPFIHRGIWCGVLLWISIVILLITYKTWF